MRVNNVDLLNGTPVDLSADWESPPIWLGHICNYSIQLIFTDDPEGTFKLQASNDSDRRNPENNGEYVVTNWSDIGSSSQAITESGDHIWNVENAGYNFVRVIWTASGTTGSLDSARCNNKGV